MRSELPGTGRVDATLGLAVRGTGREPFTLVELLVVMVIIMILSALLLPGLRGARDRALRTACMASQRQIGVATFAFAGDHDAYPPPPHVYRWQYWTGEEGRWHCSSASIDASNNVVGRRWWTWPGPRFEGRNFANILLMENYIGNDRVFDCPSYKGDELPWPSGFRRTDLDYGLNQDMCSMHGSLFLAQDPNTLPEYQHYFAKYQTVRFSVANEPARAILLSDRVMVLGAHWTDAAYIGWHGTWGLSGWNDPATVGEDAIWYHETGLNLVAYDGAAHWVSREEALRIRQGTGQFIWNVQPAPAVPYGRPMW